MVQIAEIHRHPIKGFTAEKLDRINVDIGQGLPFDRHVAITGGKNDEAPVAGGWVLSRTFLILTTHPELARYRATLANETELRVTAPDGSSAIAYLGYPNTFEGIEKLIAREFADGPNGPPRLIEQAAGRGHWDFEDSEISIINLETVRALSTDINKTTAFKKLLEPERFRGNIYISGLPAWEEFSWPGQRITVGDVTLDIRRPIQRCAMTSTEPGTGLREINLPVEMNRLYGHGFCGVYAKVTTAGQIKTGHTIKTGNSIVASPYDKLPVNAAPISLWPRFVSVTHQTNGIVLLQSTMKQWPLPKASTGMTLNILADSLNSTLGKVVLLETNGTGYLCHADDLPNPTLSRLLVSGPFGKIKNSDE